METNTLSSEIKPLSEEMANKLIKAFENSMKATEEIHGMVENIFRLAMQEAATASAKTVLKYTEKAMKATFLTRWYWDKKARKAHGNFYDVCEYIKKHYNKSGTKIEGR